MKKTLNVALMVMFLISGLTASAVIGQDINQRDIDRDSTYESSSIVPIIKNDAADIQQFNDHHLSTLWEENLRGPRKVNTKVNQPYQSNDTYWPITESDFELQCVHKEDTLNQNTPLCDTSGYTPHAPISIKGDENFTEENGVTGGSGTRNDPYIIEGWNITESPAIAIRYTSSYFVIQHCLLKVQSGGGFAVIELRDDVCHGVVSHVIIDSSENYPCYSNGIELCRGAHDITIKDTLITAFQGVYFTPQFSSNRSWIIPFKNITIDNCTILHCGVGFNMYETDSLLISNTSVSIYDPRDSPFLFIAFDIQHSKGINILNCSVFSNDQAFYLSNCSKFTLRENKIVDNTKNFEIFWDIAWEYGFYNPKVSTAATIGCFDHDIDTSNTIDGRPIYYMNNKNDFVLDGYDEEIGFVAVYHCHNATVKNIHDAQIYVIDSEHITIESCQPLKHTDYGIVLFHATQNHIVECNIVDAGLLLFFSPSNTLVDTAISIENTAGLHVAISGIFIYGNQSDEYIQDIDSSTTINNKSVYYFVGEDNLQIGATYECGFLGFVNCHHVTIADKIVTNNGQGILLANTTDAEIQRCTFLGNTFGLFFYDSHHVTISHCLFTGNNYFGIEMESCDSINIIGCRCSLNGVHIEMKLCTKCLVGLCYFGFVTGFQLVDCWNNTFVLNTFYTDQCMLTTRCDTNEFCYNKMSLCIVGIDLEYSCENNIHHNDFIFNRENTIFLYWSNENKIHHNNIKYTGNRRLEGQGIRMSSSHNNRIHYNNILGNDIGIRVWVYAWDLNVTYNYWGSRDGPSGHGYGSGDILDAWLADDVSVYYEPFLKKPVRFHRLLEGLRFFGESVV